MDFFVSKEIKNKIDEESIFSEKIKITIKSTSFDIKKIYKKNKSLYVTLFCPAHIAKNLLLKKTKISDIFINWSKEKIIIKDYSFISIECNVDNKEDNQKYLLKVSIKI